jgi:hypothetical protein
MDVIGEYQMATLDGAFPRKLDFGRVVRDVLMVMGKQPALVLGLSAILAGLPSFFGDLFAARHWTGEAYFFSGWGAVATFARLFVGSFLAASLYRLSLDVLRGETPTPAAVFTTGAQLFLPLFAVNLMLTIAICVGLILLIVPGVMMAMAWCLAGVALVAEQTGITQVFGRSAELTRGHRWQLLALFLLFGVAVAILEGVFGAVGFTTDYLGALFSPMRMLGTAIISTLVTAVVLPGLAAIYVQLSEIKAR